MSTSLKEEFELQKLMERARKAAGVAQTSGTIMFGRQAVCFTDLGLRDFVAAERANALRDAAAHFGATPGREAFCSTIQDELLELSGQPVTLSPPSFGACGCGKPIRYETTSGQACNKYMRCLTREEAVDALQRANARLYMLDLAASRKVADHVGEPDEMVNGLTEDETSATPSVTGLTQPSRDDLSYWTGSRRAILKAIADAGFVLTSNQAGFKLMRQPNASAQHDGTTELQQIKRSLELANLGGQIKQPILMADDVQPEQTLFEYIDAAILAGAGSGA